MIDPVPRPPIGYTDRPITFQNPSVVTENAPVFRYAAGNRFDILSESAFRPPKAGRPRGLGGLHRNGVYPSY